MGTRFDTYIWQQQKCAEVKSGKCDKIHITYFMFCVKLGQDNQTRTISFHTKQL